MNRKRISDFDLHSKLKRRSEGGRSSWSRDNFAAGVNSKMDAEPTTIRVSRAPALAGLIGVVGIAVLLVVVLPRVLPSSPAAQTATPQPIRSSASQETTEGTFTLTIVAGSASYGVNQRIDVHGEMLYEGPSESAVVTGVGRLVSGFGVEQVDGPYSMGPSWGQPCVPDALERGVPRVEEFRKSGAFDAADPLAGFYNHYLADPVFRLPAGTWRVTAYTEFWAGECGEGDYVTLETSVDIVVWDSPVPVATETQQPSTSPDAAPTPLPTVNGANSLECPGNANVVDRTGLVVGCQMEVVDYHNVADGPINPDGDLRRVRFEWGTNVCVERTGVGAEVLEENGSLSIDITERPIDDQEGCDSPGAVALELTLTRDTNASSVGFSVLHALPYQQPPVTPTRVPSPSPSPSATQSHEIACDYLGWDGSRGWRDPGSTPDPEPIGLPVAPQFIDETGLVTTCRSVDSRLQIFGIPVIDDVDDPVDQHYHLNWVATECDENPTVTFAPEGERFSVAFDRGSVEPCEVLARRSIQIELSEPVQSSLIDLVPEAKTVIECANPAARIGAVVTDNIGVIDACTTAEPSSRDLGSDDWGAWNLKGDDHIWQVEWSGSPCDAAVGLTLTTSLNIEVGPRPDGQTLGINLHGETLCRASLVRHAIQITVEDALNAEQIEFVLPQE